MSTGQKKVNIFLKKFLPQQQIVDNFLEYLLAQSREAFKTTYPNEGIFSGGVISAAGADEFLVSTPLKATDGQGRLLQLDPLYASCKFENALGVPYHVGLKYQDLPRSTEVNVRTGQIEYTFFEESIGELAQPDAVVDNGTNITLTVDSVCEAGVSNAGRNVRCWLKRAVGQADAFFEGVVVFSGGANKITTTHLFGQTAGAVSVDPADYEVALLGPSVKRNTDLSLDPNYAYLGTVDGAGAGNPPSSFDQTPVNQLYSVGSGLQAALDQLKSFLVGGGAITWDLTTETLSWTSQFKVVMPHKSYGFTIAPSSVAAIADGDALYILLDLVGGAKPMIKVASGAMPNDELAYAIAVRDGSNIYFRDGALELVGDATPTTGRIDGITDDLLAYIGALSESDSDPNYSSTNVVTQGSSLTAAIGALDNAVALALAESSLEDTVIANPGDTIITFPLLTFDANNAVWDLKIYRNPSKVKQDPTGGLGEDYRKIGSNQVEFAYPLRGGDKITGRMERTASLPLAPQAFFLNYVTGITGFSVPVGGTYNVGTDKLSAYRNGLYLVRSGVIGAPVDRYLESSATSIAPGLIAAPSDIFTFENLASPPSARQHVTGVTGTVLTVPSYVMGSKRLRVFRNGLLMNVSALGGAIDQYSETSSTSITLAVAAVLSDVFTFYVAGSAPDFREDLDGFSAALIPISGVYTIGDKRLLVFKNGVLLFNSLSLGTASDRYQETGTSEVTLGAAAVPTDWFSFIYK